MSRQFLTSDDGDVRSAFEDGIDYSLSLSLVVAGLRNL